MKGVLFNQIGEVTYGSVDDPQIEHPRDAIVEVLHTAICGSDLHVYHGRETGIDGGTVMGHEFVGRIVETGPACDIPKNTLVYAPFTTNCGTCGPCLRGLTSRCELGQLFGWREKGSGLHGAQAEAVRVPLADATLKPIPDFIAPKIALLLGDILSTGYYCAHRADIEEDEPCAVIGCGPVGLMACLAAAELGAEVFAYDLDPHRLKLAQQFGAQPGRDDLTFRSVLEAVGAPSSAEKGFSLLEPGGTLSMVGVHTAPHFPFSPTACYDKNITFRIGRCPARFYMNKLIHFAEKHQDTLLSIFTHEFELQEGARAYELFDKKEDGCLKVLLRP